MIYQPIPIAFEGWKSFLPPTEGGVGYYVTEDNELSEVYYVPETPDISEHYRVVTHQSNGWDRINRYYPDGTSDKTYEKTHSEDETDEVSTGKPKKKSKALLEKEAKVRELTERLKKVEQDINNYVNNPVPACLYCKKNAKCAHAGGDCTFIYDPECSVDLSTADYPGNPDKQWVTVARRNNVFLGR